MPGASKRSPSIRTKRSDPVSPEKVSDSDIHSFTLRIHRNVVDQVDEAVAKHPVIRNRNTWIVNAIVEQLKREG